MSGIFNVGTGKAASFRDLITAMFRALGRAPNIEYVDMPQAIRGQYQYFTQAKVENLRRAGYNAGFTPIEEGVGQVRHVLPESARPISVTAAGSKAPCSISRKRSGSCPSRPCSASEI